MARAKMGHPQLSPAGPAEEQMLDVGCWHPEARRGGKGRLHLASSSAHGQPRWQTRWPCQQMRVARRLHRKMQPELQQIT